MGGGAISEEPSRSRAVFQLCAAPYEFNELVMQVGLAG